MEHAPIQPSCPACGSLKLSVERRPDGNAKCDSCGTTSPYSECFIQPTQENNFAPVVSITVKKELSVKEILQHMLDRADEFTGVVVVANCKNGEQYLRSSKIDCRDKSYLLAFFQSWVMGIFKIHYDDGETEL